MYRFRKLLTKEQIFTIPNFMSFFRLVLIPFFVWLYIKKEYAVAAGLVLVSAVTDVFDGVIARKFNMVSDLGKVLDPLCDKLTHGALLVCLLTRYHYLWTVFALLAFKELLTATLGAIAVRRRAVIHSSKWYGKLCTAVLEICMILLFLFPQIPERVMQYMMLVCCVLMVFSMVMYASFFIRLIRGSDDRGGENKVEAEN